jgi:hypothetical protein
MSYSGAPDECIAMRRRRVRAALVAALLPALITCNAANELDSFSDRHPLWFYGDRVPRSQSRSPRIRHDLNAGQQHVVLDPRDFAIGNVWIERNL